MSCNLLTSPDHIKLSKINFLNALSLTHLFSSFTPRSCQEHVRNVDHIRGGKIQNPALRLFSLGIAIFTDHSARNLSCPRYWKSLQKINPADTSKLYQTTARANRKTKSLEKRLGSCAKNFGRRIGFCAYLRAINFSAFFLFKLRRMRPKSKFGAVYCTICTGRGVIPQLICVSSYVESKFQN